MAARAKLMFVASVDWSFISHRLPVALAAIREGYEVHLAAGITDRYETLVSHGIIVHPLPVDRGGTHPWRELKTLLAIFCVFAKVRPDIVHLITIKPVLYGGISARALRIRGTVAAVTGLGTAFIAQGAKAQLRRFIAVSMYRLAFSNKNLKVIFQNPDDRDRLMQSAGLTADKVVMIRGAGVDLSQYACTPLPEGVPVAVMAARLLGDKGVREFVEAAGMLKREGFNARFCLVGAPDPANPSCIAQSELDAWAAEGEVELWGFRTDIARVFAQAHIVALPSYREGLPKSLIEAAACGRVVVTTDVPGCRDAIDPGTTGVLVPVRDAAALAQAMKALLSDMPRCKAMGLAGRKLAEKEFDIAKVVEAHLALYRQLLL